MKSGSFSLLEPSGPVQTCNGIALPFTLLLYQISAKSDNECASFRPKVRSAFIFRAEQFGLVTGVHETRFVFITAVLMMILHFCYVTLRLCSNNSRMLDTATLETSVTLYPTARCHVSGHRILEQHC